MNAVATFDWTGELEKTVLHSLVTSFGLDFLLIQDKKGGDVDTVHNARHGIYASETEKTRYDKRGDYNSTEYHSHKNYVRRGQADKTLQKQGRLHDCYRNSTMGVNESRDLDHIISAKEIHDDRGRVLAELNGSDLANSDSNLSSTGHSINRSKQNKQISKFLDDLKTSIPQMESDLRSRQERLAKMPKETPEDLQKHRALEDDIRKKTDKIEQLKSIDPESMLDADHEARKSYEQTVNRTYYSSSKFMKQAASAAADAGVRMGIRQMLGLVMAEVWFELREQMPDILRKHKPGFQFDSFLGDMLGALRSIWDRLKSRFHDFLVSFRDGAIGGVLSSVTTTLFNIFATTEKMIVKLIREMWNHLVQAIKIIVFNPEGLGRVELVRAVTKILTAGIAAVAGTTIYAYLSPLLSFPFGSELAAFVGALTTGIITLGFQYFLDCSAMMQKVWAFLGSYAHSHTLEQFKAINARLDTYLRELASIEFNLDSLELQAFVSSLAACNDEVERAFLLHNQVMKRNIDLPFEIGNQASTRKWLSGLVKK